MIDSVLADRLHRVSDDLADRFVIRGDRRDLSRLFLRLQLAAHLAQLFHDERRALFKPALQFHRIGARREILEPFFDQRMREDRCGGGSVARDIVRLRGDLFDELRPHILEYVRVFLLLSDRHPIVGDVRATELLVDDDVSSTGTEGDAHCIRQLVDPALHSAPRFITENDFFGHDLTPPLLA